jgi:hypothetical protein
MITQLLRKVRAVLIITAIWVLFWTPFAIGLNQILADILFPNSIDSPYTPVSVWAIWGALCGFVFAILLALTERGRAVGTLSTARVLSWAAIASALVPVVYWILTGLEAVGFGWAFWETVLSTVGISALLGVVCGIMTLSFMRAGSTH